MSKAMKITVTLSTNPATAHIGPFFMDVRDVSRGRNVQVTTRVGTAAKLAEDINTLSILASAHGITLDFADETLNNDFTAQGGLIGTEFSD